MTINAWGSDDPAEVAKGGTGNATLTDHGIMLGSGTAAVTVTSAPTDGQLLIGSTGVDPVLGTLTQPAAGITITPGAGTVTFALDDDLAAVEGLSGTGLATRTAANTWTTRTITAGTGITVMDGDGVAGNPTISSSAASGSWVFLTETTVSGATTATFDNTIITSTYNNYCFMFKLTASDSAEISAQVSPNNGSTIRTSGYLNASGALNRLTIVPQRAGSSTIIMGNCFLYDITSSSKKTSTGNAIAANNALLSGAGFFNTSTEAHNWIRFSASTMTGTIAVYGIIQ